MARPIRVLPKPQSTTPLTMVERPSVMRPGASSGAVVSATAIRSTSDDANIPVIAAVELSGPPTANGNELPSAIMVARTADEMQGRRNTVGQVWRQRACEDQQRV